MTISEKHPAQAPHELVLALPKNVRENLLHVVADAIRWGQDRTETQTRELTPVIYSPALRYSASNPHVALARGRDAGYAHAASCAVSELAVALGLDGLRLGDIADVPQPLSLWHAASRTYTPADDVAPTPEETRHTESRT
jgi:hypothetical protein